MATGFLSVQADYKPITNLLSRMIGGADIELQALIEDAAGVMTEQLKITAPVSHNPSRPAGGTLRDSLVFDIGQLGATLLGVDYAAYVIEGTAPHAIDAKNHPNLVFFWEKIGATFVGPHVNHPGTRPNDFRMIALENAIDMGELELVCATFFQRLVGGGG